MWTSDVLANMYEVPLVLGDEGKRKAIAAKLVHRIGKEDLPRTQRAAENVVALVIQLGDSHGLDGLLGRYDEQRDKVIADLPASGDNEPGELRRELAGALIDDLVKAVQKNPRDIGQPSPS